MKKMDRKKLIVGEILVIVILVLIIIYLSFFKTYSVYFDTKMGTSIETQEVKKDHSATKPADPTSTGYEFIGWFLDGEEYDFDTKVTEDITLTARWKQISE